MPEQDSSRETAAAERIRALPLAQRASARGYY